MVSDSGFCLVDRISAEVGRIVFECRLEFFRGALAPVSGFEFRAVVSAVDLDGHVPGRVVCDVAIRILGLSVIAGARIGIYITNEFPRPNHLILHRFGITNRSPGKTKQNHHKSWKPFVHDYLLLTLQLESTGQRTRTADA